MIIELREFSLNSGKELYDMIQEIGPGENGYVNSGFGIIFDNFGKYLMQCVEMSKGVNLKPEHVPQTNYCLFIDGNPVGIGKLRDYLNDNLKKIGGHIGFTIRPSKRGKGFGTIILHELLRKAKEKGIKDVLLTCRESNLASRRVIEANNGKLADVIEGGCRYWINNC